MKRYLDEGVDNPRYMPTLGIYENSINMANDYMTDTFDHIRDRFYSIEFN